MPRWNSIIVFSPSAFRYNQLTVTEGFVRGLPFNDDQYIDLRDSDENFAHWPDNLHFLQQEIPTYEKLENLECKHAYAQNFVRDRADVIVVTTPFTPDTNMSSVLGAAAGGWGPWPYKWLCPVGDNQNFNCYRHLLQSGKQWTFTNWGSPEVQYCLSKPMEQRCKLEYGFWITIFTIVANSLKVFCFVMTYWMVKAHTEDKKDVGSREKHSYRLLITTGDALASFLEVPDNETLGMSIVEHADFQNGIWDLRWVRIEPMLWRKRYRCAWFRTIGLRRWIVGSLVYVPSCMLVTSRLPNLANHRQKISCSRIRSRDISSSKTWLA